jgi:hypothetical protein
MTERQEILKMLSANAGTIEDNLAEFLIRNAEDLIAVGVDERKIVDAMLNIGLAHLTSLDGAPAAIAELRLRANVFEEVSAQFCQHAVRH